MNSDSSLKAFIVVAATALVCSVIVTFAAVTLQPMQRAYQDVERNRAIVRASGLTNDVSKLSDREVVGLFRRLDASIVDLDLGKIDDRHNPNTFDTWRTSGDPGLSTVIPQHLDLGKITRRSRLVTIYRVNNGAQMERMLLPIYGQGMWSTLYGFIALEPDLNTIADIVFFEQAETAGIGDRILDPDWQASWRGRRLYDEAGVLQLRVAGGAVSSAEIAAAYQVDAISGATVTVDAVANLVRYWFGPHGFAPFLESYRVEVGR